jgi:hypothetical protein
MALSLASEIPLPRLIQSAASSRTLTPVGVRSQDYDNDSDDFDVGMSTPPRRNVWGTLDQLQAELGLSDESLTKSEDTILKKNPFAFMQECQMCDHGFTKQVFALPPGPVKSTMAHKDAYVSNAVMPLAPGPVKTRLLHADPAPSMGSVGHPYTCGEACKYFRRKGGCRDGGNCTKCHLCHWSRDVMQRKPTAQESAPVRVAVSNTTPDDGPPSVGSIGHPFSCGVACKYHSKKAGCKDGKFCSRCHMCRWSRGCEKGNGKGEINEVKTSSEVECNPSSLLPEASEASPFTGLLGKERLPSPRRIEIQGNINCEVPMYITVLGSTSF